MTWPLLYIEAALSFAALFSCGILLLLSLGIKNCKSLLIYSPLLSMGLLGILSLLSPFFSWTINSVIAAIGILFILFLAFRALIQRSDFTDNLKVQRASVLDQLKRLIRNRLFVTAFIGAFIGSLITAYILSGLSLDSTIGMNGFDEPFHYSVVRHILDSGDASPIGAGSVMGSESAIYPDLWHAITALLILITGQPIVNTGWVTCLLLMGFYVPTGTVFLTLPLFKSPSSLLVVLAAIIPSLLPHSMFLFIGYGSLFANLAGLSMLPLALSGPIFLINKRCIREEWSKDSFIRGKIFLGFVIDILALGFTHPATIFLLFLTLLPLFIARARNLITKIASVCLFGLIWVVLQFSPLFFRTVNCLDLTGYDAVKGIQVTGWFHLDYQTLANSSIFPFALFLAIVIIASVIALRIRSKWNNSWYLVSVALLLALSLVSLFPMNWFSAIMTGYFYRDFIRLISIFVFFLAPLCAGIPVSLYKEVSDLASKPLRWVLRLLLSIVLLALLALLLKCALITKSEYFEMTSTDGTLSDSQIEFMETVADLTDGSVVLNNDTDDSHFLYSLYGVNALLKGNSANQMSPMEENLCTLIENISEFGEDTETGRNVREAAQELHVEYVTKMSDNFISTMRFDELSRIIYEHWDSIRAVTSDTPGFELVYELDGMQLFRLIYPDESAY